MKRVPRLDGDPPGLTAWRAGHPEDLHVGADASGVWERFRADAAYRELLAALVSRQQGLCLYCEQRVTRADGSLLHADYQVEHVLPKAHDVTRTLDGGNLVLACGGGTYKHHRDAARYSAGVRGTNESCGQAKADHPLPTGWDPRDLPWDRPVVTVSLEGRLCADVDACAALGVPAQAVEDAIALLNLNCERLRLARQKVRDNVVEWLVPAMNAVLEGSHIGEDEQSGMFQLLAGGRLGPDQHGHLRAFWTVERLGFGELGEVWIQAHQDVLGFG